VHVSDDGEDGRACAVADADEFAAEMAERLCLVVGSAAAPQQLREDEGDLCAAHEAQEGSQAGWDDHLT
jgi:hypothetical protein